MPIQYIIDAAQRLVSTTVTGVVSLAEMREHYRTLAADPAFSPEFDSLIDFSDAAAFAAKGEEVRDLSRSIPSVRGSRRAIVVGSDLHYGLGRMVSLTRSPELEIEVFRSRDEAVRWLRKTQA